MLSPYEAHFDLKHDTPTYYDANSKKPSKGKELFFGAVAIKRSYVSYYLFSLYLFPELGANLSPELKMRHQGKSCFNFTRAEGMPFDKLEELTKRSLQRFRQEGLL